MKTTVTLLALAAGVNAFAQANFGGQFNDAQPLFPPTPITGFEPSAPTNLGRTNLFGTNVVPGIGTNTAPGVTNPVTGLTNTVPPGANVPAEIPTLPGTPPVTPGNPPPFQGAPGLPGTVPPTPQTPPGLPGNTPGLPGNQPALPGNQPFGEPGGAPPAGTFTIPGNPGSAVTPVPVQPAPLPPKVPLGRQ